MIRSMNEVPIEAQRAAFRRYEDALVEARRLRDLALVDTWAEFGKRTSEAWEAYQKAVNPPPTRGD